MTRLTNRVRGGVDAVMGATLGVLIMKRIVMLMLACAFFLTATAGCSWLCCDPCKDACKPACEPSNCNPCQGQ